MHLDIRSRVKLVELVSLGTLNSSFAHPCETFRRAVIAGSASIIVAHNHPSGEVEPSDEDTNVTKLLHESSNILGITLFDHIFLQTINFLVFEKTKWETSQERELIRREVNKNQIAYRENRQFRL